MSDKKRGKGPGGDGEDNDVVDLSNETDSEPGKTSEESELRAELEKSKNDYLYLLAEFDNYKKHAIKERSDLIRFGNERLVRELLEIVDNFERALSQELTPENFQSLKNGVDLIYKELQGLLAKFGVREVNPVGQPFDPSLHEALTSEQTSEQPAGHITRVFKKAYKLHDKLIRPAQVVVATPPPTTSEAED